MRGKITRDARFASEPTASFRYLERLGDRHGWTIDAERTGGGPRPHGAGPRQFEFDKTGNGAVLCAWSVYLSIQAKTAACGLQRRPTDDAMDEAIAAIDEFILANSSLHPTRPFLEEFKHRAAEADLAFARKQGLEKACSSRDLEHFRSISPDQIRASVNKLLEVPREPVMNPCL